MEMTSVLGFIEVTEGTNCAISHTNPLQVGTQEVMPRVEAEGCYFGSSAESLYLLFFLWWGFGRDSRSPVLIHHGPGPLGLNTASYCLLDVCLERLSG